MTCIHLANGKCGFVEDYLGIPWVVDPRACAACNHGVGPVTSSLILSAAFRAGVPIAADEEKVLLATIPQESVPTDGPGSELQRRVSFFARKQADCKCNDRVAIMNVWGCDKCQSKIDVIVGWLEEEATESRILTSKVALRFLVNSAIAHARAKMQRS